MSQQPSGPSPAAARAGSAEAHDPSAGAQRRALPPTAAATTAEQPWPVRLLSTKIGDYVARMSAVWVEGQLVQVTRRPGQSTAFCVLRDADVDMSLSVTTHTRVLDALGPALVEGARVVVHATPEFWGRRGSLQLRADAIRPVGTGELLARVEALRRVLTTEGLFADARKQPLPFLPRVVGLVCGRASAAERDVVVTARTRWPGVRFEVREVVVQGVDAVAAVSRAVAELDHLDEVDVVVVARGGGSLEDLLPFSDEALLRAVAACRTPVVSAVGHEVDNPLLDLVADVRASTPTDAGRRVVPAVAEELAGVSAARERLHRAVRGRVAAERAALAGLRARPVLAEPSRGLTQRREAVEDARARGRRALRARLAHDAAEVRGLRRAVRTLSPAATLERGYAVVQDADGAVLRDALAADPGDQLRVRLAAGELVVGVEAQVGPDGEVLDPFA
ncbi:exodeoxyribonuclease VII large subunit [Pseudokineococcus basanitobsidens]|uniref:Exodeoxyribonuclease 7 large subunit n=1 Tax=Pseudokineococcus basanitobsidens TaxID=1926649 RepID=A0ABU8RMH7_9ACTN